MSNFKQRKQIRLEGFDYNDSAYVYHITICTYDKLNHFKKKEVAEIIEGEIEFRMFKEITLFCYCIMPDHVHMLLSLAEDYIKKRPLTQQEKRSLQNWVSAFKRYTSRVANQMYNIKPLWQKNFYDHIVRKEESFLKIAEYIVNNPVRKGMVEEWEDYPCSRIVDNLPD